MGAEELAEAERHVDLVLTSTYDTVLAGLLSGQGWQLLGRDVFSVAGQLGRVVVPVYVAPPMQVFAVSMLIDCPETLALLAARLVRAGVTAHELVVEDWAHAAASAKEAASAPFCN